MKTFKLIRIAFGSAVPEIVFNSVSAITHDSSISLTSLLGSAMIAFGMIPGLCILLTKVYLPLYIKNKNTI